jgi:HD-like signal output (HDOD) protein
MSETPAPSTDQPKPNQEYALVVYRPGKSQQVLARFVTLLLNYRYGLEVIPATSFVRAFSVVQQRRQQIRCTFVVHDRRINSANSIAGLNLEGQFPLIVLLPNHLVNSHRELCTRLRKVLFCSWENCFTHGESSLQHLVQTTFAELGIGALLGDAAQLPYEVLQHRVEARLRHVTTLPTLPELALRIMAMVRDPQSTVAELEHVVINDPAIVHKLLQVVNSPVFAGAGHQGDWSMQEAIVRLGRQKVGAVAQQVKLMSHLIRPEESGFHLRRYWVHSVGCALIADRLYTGKLLPLPAELSFSEYWIGALLHDVGKLVLGFFFWQHFETVVEHMGDPPGSFREAEKALGDAANHEYLGQLLLLKSRAGRSLVEAVGTHHTTGGAPGALVCLLHVANNLCKELGLGYLPGESARYSPAVLGALRLRQEDLSELARSLGAELRDHIEQTVENCLGPS